ncbi:MAG: deoxynucleoside kinase [Prevotella sp.]
MHIAIAGNIGSGKTTLTKMLAQYYGWTPRIESVDVNPYLQDYYRSIERWAFNLEVYFLKQRFHDLIEITKSKETIVQDRSIYEGVYVFAANNRAMGHLNERDFDTYMELFEAMLMIVRYPDLMIYLRSSVPHLVEHIQLRGRDYEQTIPIEYLNNLNERYEDFIFNKYKGKKMIIEADELDFEHNPKDFSKILDAVNAELYGLFSKM